MSQMVHNGEGKCPRKSLSGIEEKIISEDENAYSKVLKSWLKFPFHFVCLQHLFKLPSLSFSKRSIT